MKEKKSLREKFNDLSKAKKAQAIIASVLSLFLLIAIPTFAWFALNSRVETLTKIKAPSTLDIKSGHAYSIEYLDLSDVDVTELDGGGTTGHKDYIFAVKAGSNISAYDIQIAHTTNIPFTYTLYRASELGDSEESDTVPAGNVATFEDGNAAGESSDIVFFLPYGTPNAGSKSTMRAKEPDTRTAVSVSAQ